MLYEVEMFINDWLTTITIQADNANEAWEIAKQRRLSESDKVLMIREYSEWGEAHVAISNKD